MAHTMTAHTLLVTRLRDDQNATSPLDLPLDFASRQRSRQRLELPDGTVLAIALPTGTVLRPGAVLQVEAEHPGFRIVARPQALMRVNGNAHLLTRAAYHLGNRHCTIQVEAESLLLEPDSVLREMLVGLGARVDQIEAPFEPETGAYGGGHRHGHAETFDSDYALAQATFQLHEGRSRHAVLLPGADHGG